MANLDADAILTRVRNILEEATGTLRTIAANTYEGQIFAGLDDSEKVKRALIKPRTEATITRIARHPASPPAFGSLVLYEFDLEVLVIRALQPEHLGATSVADDARDDVKALAARDGDVIAQALTYMGNVDSATTGVVSGRLTYVDSEITVEIEDAPRVESRHNFQGIAQVTLATS